MGRAAHQHVAKAVTMSDGRPATVQELWRFPVKSMQGERIDASEVTSVGLVGDRAYAVIDADTGRVGSAKHPRLWSGLLQCEARYDTSSGARRTLAGGHHHPAGRRRDG
jgi:uncharacterized protein YcbX